MVPGQPVKREKMRHFLPIFYVRKWRASIMRWPLIAENHRAWVLRLPIRLTPHQHLNTPGQGIDFPSLACDNIAQIFYDPGHMGQFFFDILHGCVLHRHERQANGRPR